MKKTIFIFAIIAIFLLQVVAVSATAEETKIAWKDAKEISKEKRNEYRDVQKEFRKNNSEENRELLIEAGKETLHAGLNEAEAWLLWREEKSKEDTKFPEELKEEIQSSIDENLAKIESLREEIDAIETQIELGVTFIDMLFKYREVLSDVSKHTGNSLIYLAEQKLEKSTEFEEKLRVIAEGYEHEAALESLDNVKESLNSAKEHIDEADEKYDSITVPGKPIITFHEGNKHLKDARKSLIDAHKNLREAYRLLLNGE